jgi:hypothetical protein
MLEPVYDQIEEFEDDWAKVQDQGRWGVVNREGKWVLPARYDGAYDLEYLGDGLMLVDEPDAKRERGGYRESAYRVINLRTGKASEPVIGKPQKLQDGRYLGELARGAHAAIRGLDPRRVRRARRRHRRARQPEGARALWRIQSVLCAARRPGARLPRTGLPRDRPDRQDRAGKEVGRRHAAGVDAARRLQ